MREAKISLRLLEQSLGAQLSRSQNQRQQGHVVRSADTWYLVQKLQSNWKANMV